MNADGILVTGFINDIIQDCPLEIWISHDLWEILGVSFLVILNRNIIVA